MTLKELVVTGIRSDAIMTAHDVADLAMMACEGAILAAKNEMNMRKLVGLREKLRTVQKETYDAR